jgi:regulator of sigma E protease
MEPISQSVAGPVGLTSLTGEIIQTKSPLLPYLNFIALLSLNLAILNILPFPALDGGRLLFLAVEAVSKRRMKAEVERFIHSVGMAILLALIILVTVSDISKLFH